MVVYKPAQNPFEGTQAAKWYHHRGMNLVPFSCTGGKKRAIEEWKPWQEARQPWEEIANWPWHAGVAAINGIGDWRSIDIDETHSFNLILDILDMLDLPPDYPWVVQSGSRKGYHLWFKSEGRPFDGTLYKEDGKSVYVGEARLPEELDTPLPFKQMELRWARCCTILPPTIHPSGQRYIWIHGLPEGEPSYVFLHQIEGMMRSLTTIATKEQEEHKRLERIRNSPPVELRRPTTPREERAEQRRMRKWADSALDDEIKCIRSTTIGGRDTQLNTSAFNLGQFIPNSYLSESLVRNELYNAGISTGLSPRIVNNKIERGLEAGKKDPRVYQPRAFPQQSPPKKHHLTGSQRKQQQDQSASLSTTNGNVVDIAKGKQMRSTSGKTVGHTKASNDITDNDLIAYSADDAGNAEAFVALYGHMYLFCATHNWMYYNGTHWEENKHEIDEDIIKSLRRRRHAAENLEREDIRKCCICDMKRVEGCRKALLSKLSVKISVFDNNPDLLNCKNGVVDLRTGHLTPHHHSQRFTYCSPVAYHPDTDTSTWTAFLSTVIGGGQELIDYLQIWAGYSFTGHTTEECALYLYGETRAGKGTIAETLLAILPRPLGVSTDFNTFTVKREGDVSNFDLADLKPCRLVIASESNAYQSLNAAKFKSMTGGDYIRCSKKYGDFFEYRPQFKVWLLSNFPPNGDANDKALWGRIREIDFPHSFLGEEDHDLKEKLKTPKNLEGVLAWVIEGARKWYAVKQQGIPTPASVKNTVETHRANLDTVQHWLEECAELGEGDDFWTPSNLVINSYTNWCDRNNVEARKGRYFAAIMRTKGCIPTDPRRRNGILLRGFQGIRLVTHI